MATSSILERVAQKVESRERLTWEDALELFQTSDVVRLGRLADQVKHTRWSNRAVGFKSTRGLILLMLLMSQAQGCATDSNLQTLLNSLIQVATVLPSDAASGSSTQPGCSGHPELPGCDPTHINTRGWEDSPYITPDGSRLYFMYTPWNFYTVFQGGQPKRPGPDRSGHHSNANPWQDANLYVGHAQSEGAWSAPINLALNQYGGGCCAMPTTDGKRIFYQRGVPGPTINTDIYMIEQRDNGTWKEPVNLGGAINTEWVEDNPHISADERTLYWTSTRPDGHGKKDLWCSTRQPDGMWPPAKNLGPTINTSEDEDQIWVSEDGKTAYFNRGLTLYTSELVGNRWSMAVPVQFTVPVPEAAEASLTRDGQWMYFALVDRQKKDIVLVSSQRQSDGRWGPPAPLD